MTDLQECRKEIDIIDKEILRLFEKRMKVCENVAEYKIHTGKKVLDPKREQDKITVLKDSAHGEFNELGAQELFQQIMAISRKRQYQLLTKNGVENDIKDYKMVDALPLTGVNVVFQGVEGAYSYAAMRAYFSDAINSYHVKTFRDAMEEVASGKADYAVLPIENTAGAAKKIHEELDRTQAAIASRAAGELYGLSVMAENICYNEENVTRFIIVSAHPVYEKSAAKISVSFELPHESGTLYHMLSHFIYNGLSMTKIESRPITGKKWEYRFFVDFEGNLEEPAVKNALRGLEAEANRMRVLGNYGQQEEE